MATKTISKQEDKNNNKSKETTVPNIITSEHLSSEELISPPIDQNPMNVSVNSGRLNTVRRRSTAGNLTNKRTTHDVKSEFFLKQPEFVGDVRRNSYGGRSCYDEDTQVEDGFLTTSLCSTEL